MVEVFVELAGVDAAVSDVGVDGCRVAVSQLEGCGGFPWLVEAVDVGEVVGAAGVAEFVEHAAASDGLQLVRVTDEREPPAVVVR